MSELHIDIGVLCLLILYSLLIVFDCISL